MKKIFMLMTTIFACMVSFAQTKGDMYISGSIFMDLGTQKTTLSDGSYSTSISQPSGSSFGLGVEYGYFATDNLRLSMAMSVPFSSTPMDEEDGKWLKDTSIGFGINPNVAYYIRLADKFYYTPEVGVAFEFGSYKEQLSSSDSYKQGYWGWNAYVNILALEFRVTDKIAIGANVGAISYGSTRITDKESDAYLASSQFNFGLNNSDLHVRFYF